MRTYKRFLALFLAVLLAFGSFPSAVLAAEGEGEPAEEIVSSEPTPAPTPEPTPGPTPVPTPEPTAVPTPEPAPAPTEQVTEPGGTEQQAPAEDLTGGSTAEQTAAPTVDEYSSAPTAMEAPSIETEAAPIFNDEYGIMPIANDRDGNLVLSTTYEPIKPTYEVGDKIYVTFHVTNERPVSRFEYLILAASGDNFDTSRMVFEGYTRSKEPGEKINWKYYNGEWGVGWQYDKDTKKGLKKNEQLDFTFSYTLTVDDAGKSIKIATKAAIGSGSHVKADDIYINVQKQALNVEIIGASGSEVYNGSEQSASGFTYVVKDKNGTILDNNLVTVTSGIMPTGTGTDVGTYPVNPQDCQFLVGPKNSAEYSIGTITYVNGQLTITPRPITVSVVTDDSPYVGGQGEVKVKAGTIGGKGLVAGHVVTLVPDTGSVSTGSAGETTIDWTGSAKITDAAGTDVTDNYQITYAPGKVTVKPMHTIDVSVTGGTAEPDGSIKVPFGEDQTITFTADEGYALESVTVDGEYAELSVLTKKGDGSYTYKFNSVIKDHTIDVVFVQLHTVTYHNGGEVPEEVQVKHGNTIEAPTPEREHYNFKGWAKEPDGAVEYGPGAEITVNENLDLYAVWQVRTYQQPFIAYVDGLYQDEVKSDAFQMSCTLVFGDGTEIHLDKDMGAKFGWLGSPSVVGETWTDVTISWTVELPETVQGTTITVKDLVEAYPGYVIVDNYRGTADRFTMDNVSKSGVGVMSVDVQMVTYYHTANGGAVMRGSRAVTAPYATEYNMPHKEPTGATAVADPGYVFKGWYTCDESGILTSDTPVTTDAALTAANMEHVNDTTVKSGQRFVPVFEKVGMNVTGGTWEYAYETFYPTVSFEPEAGAEGLTVQYSTDEKNWQTEPIGIMHVAEGPKTVFVQAVDEDGNVVCEAQKAVLSVTPHPVTVKSSDVEYQYYYGGTIGGAASFKEDCGVEVFYEAKDSHGYGTFIGTRCEEVINVGTYPNHYTFSFNWGYPNLTGQDPIYKTDYAVTCVYGTLKVVPINLYFGKNMEETVPYNGEEQEFQITEKNLKTNAIGTYTAANGYRTKVASTDTLTADFHGTEVGTYDELNWKIVNTATGADMSDNYHVEWVGGLTIEKAEADAYEPSVSIVGWTYGEEPNAPKATVEGPGADKYGVPTYTYSADGVTWTEEVPTNAGEYTVKATWKETENLPELDITASFTIAKAKVTVTAEDKSITYGDALPDLTATVEGKPADGVDVIYTLGYAESETPKAAGTYDIIVSAGENPNYDVTVENGTLTIEAKGYSPDDPDSGITVTAPADVTYNGKSQELKPVIKDGETVLTENKDYTLSYSEDTTNAGTVTVTVTFQGNYSGETSTSYQIEPITLQFRQVRTEVYTGEKITMELSTDAEDFHFTSGGELAEGDSLIFHDSITGTDAGTYHSEKSIGKQGIYNNTSWGVFEIKDEDENDVRNNYIISGSASLTIVPQKITVNITGFSKSFVYDGEKHEVNGYSHDAPEGVTVAMDSVDVAHAEGVAPGEYPMGLTKDRFTVNGGKNYEIEDVIVADGALTITDRGQDKDHPLFEISVQPNGDTVTYDGTEQSVSGFEELTFEVAGHTYTVEGLSASASGTDAGNYPVTVTGTAVVKDADGNDVTGQFKVNIGSADLDIDRAKVTVKADDKSITYGDALPELTATDNKPAGGVDVNYTLGYADGVAPEAAGTYDILVSVGENPNYDVTVEKGTLTIEAKGYSPDDPDSGITVAAPAGVTYNGGAQTPAPEVRDGDKLLQQGTDYTLEYSNNTDAGTAQVTVNFTGNYSGTASTSFTIDPKPVTVTTGSATQVYDGTALTAAGSIDGLVDGQTATVNTTSITDAGSVSNAYTITWGSAASGNYTVTDSTIGTLTVTARPVTLTSGGGTKVYDGTPLTNSTVTVTGRGFVGGQSASYTFTGSQTDVGSSPNSFTYTLTGGAKESNYAITTATGTLTVTVAPATAMNVNTPGSYLYDGAAHRWAPDVTGIGGAALIEGTDYTVAYSTDDFTDAGTVTVTVNGQRNYSGSVTRTYQITPRTVVLTAASATKVYDGAALTNGTVTVTGNGFAAGQGAAYNVTGSQTNAGSSANGFTYTLNGNTSAANYRITTVPGTLTVTPAALTVNTPGSYLYDGAAHQWAPTVRGVGGRALTAGTDYAVAYSTGNFTDAGAVTATVTGQGNYTGSVARTYRITPRTVVMTSDSATKAFDGTALRAQNVTVSGNGFAAGDGASYSFTGRRTLVGDGSNTFTYTLDAGTDADNYSIMQIYGTLSVTAALPGEDDGSGENGTVEIGEDETPLGQLPEGMEAEDDGPDYILNEEVIISEDETPLAGSPMNTVETECCILHFVLMLAALGVAIYYTHDRRRRQEREFEIRSEL